jgi:hypothetical protein
VAFAGEHRHGAGRVVGGRDLLQQSLDDQTAEMPGGSGDDEAQDEDNS